MKTRLLIILGIIGLSISFIPSSFEANEFCNIGDDLKNQEELIKDNIVLIEFLKVLPSAELTRATAYVEPEIPQTSISWNTGVYSFDIQIDEYDENNPTDCFFPVGYRLNAPHLPEMIGMDFHKDPQIVLEQIDELEPKYVKGGPAIEPEPPTISDEQEQMMREYCETGIRHPDMMGIPQCIKNELVCGPRFELVDGICHLVITDFLTSEDHNGMGGFLLIGIPAIIAITIISVIGYKKSKK